MSRFFSCGRFQLPLPSVQPSAAALGLPLVMGVVNLTPDSFSDGGEFATPASAIAHAQALLEDGADILDIGAESSRPGAAAVSADEEWQRLAPVLQALVRLNVPVSVDTYKSSTMRRAIDAGASMINDIYGFRQPGAIEAVASSNVGLCAMHMQNAPATMQQAPQYDDVVHNVRDFLHERASALVQAGVRPERICLDPGYGFGKTLAHNLQLLNRQTELLGLGFALLVGLSRKSMIGALTGREPHERLAGSLTAALYAAAHGASILRVHDVRETVDALQVWRAAEQAGDS